MGIPVEEEGRDHKGNAKAKYAFAVQSNSICGQGGVNRFAIVPKNVTTGGNFGLSNLILAIWKAFQMKRLHPKCFSTEQPLC